MVNLIYNDNEWNWNRSKCIKLFKGQGLCPGSFLKKGENMNNANGGNVIYHFKGDMFDFQIKLHPKLQVVVCIWGDSYCNYHSRTALVTAWVGFGYAELNSTRRWITIFIWWEFRNELIIKSSEASAYKDLISQQWAKMNTL